jgi:hypothetical protein
MFKAKNSNHYLLVAALAFLGTALYLHRCFHYPVIHVTKQDSAVNINRNFLRFASFGNNRLISSLIWIQTLLESDLERYSQRDLSNWMYLRFLTIATLDPKFYENYLWGGMYLSIIKDDLHGAADIYERGIAVYPNDFRLLYNAGFNYYIELADYPNGLRHLEKIADHPESPPYLKFIVNKLRHETGTDYQTIMSYLLLQQQINKDPFLKDKIRQDIYALKAEHDLSCLNQVGATDCDKLDAFGAPYFQENGQWVSQYKYNAYKIFRRQEVKIEGDETP